MPDDMTNNRLAKFLSVENIGSLITIAFVFGMGYSALASESAETKAKLSNMKIEQKQLVTDVQTIQTDIAVIKNDQQHVKRQLREQKDDLKRVLMILEKRDRE